MEESDSYVYVRLTPREAKIVSMVLADTLTAEIADRYAITVERVDQIIQRAHRKVERALQKRSERLSDGEKTHATS